MLIHGLVSEDRTAMYGAMHPVKDGKRGQERRGGLHTYASEYGTNGEGVHLEHLDNLLRRVSHGQQDMRH